MIGNNHYRLGLARASYEKALALTQQEPERQFLQERIRAAEIKKVRWRIASEELCTPRVPKFTTDEFETKPRGRS